MSNTSKKINTNFDEIVAFIINKKTIISGRGALLGAKSLGGVSKDCVPVYRCEAQLMAACDLGKNWTDLANSPTLFYVTDKGIDVERTWKQFEKFGFVRMGDECEVNN